MVSNSHFFANLLRIYWIFIVPTTDLFLRDSYIPSAPLVLRHDLPHSRRDDKFIERVDSTNSKQTYFFCFGKEKFCKIRLEELEKAGDNMDCKELRQLALTYKVCREWLITEETHETIIAYTRTCVK